MKVLNRHALRANHSLYMSKMLRKTIMRRSYFEKRYLKKKQISLLESTKSIIIIAVDLVKKKEKELSVG